jgi:hypothetical protein
MTKPISQTPEDKLRDLLWQNHALSQENRQLLGDLKKAHDEIAQLKAKPAAGPPARARAL